MFLKQKDGMIVRKSISVKIGAGVAIVVVALFLSHWFVRGTFAEELGLSQSTIEQAFPTATRCSNSSI